MKLQRLSAAVLLACLVGSSMPAHAAAGPAAASPADPDAAVFIVTSRDTYRRAAALLHSATHHRDSVDTPLVVAETTERLLGELTEHIHESEQRCGGYFAFATRAEADAFIAADRTAEAIAARRGGIYTIDNQATVDPWLGEVGASNIHATITHLSSYQNRYYTSATGRQAAEWIRDTWQGLANGRSDVTAELFTGCTNCSTQPSVILTVRGTQRPDEVVVIGGHLDSINSSGAGSATQVAPGADDDASGIATITEVIRVALASGWRPQRTVKFMAYAGEEVGLRGSAAIAAKYAMDNIDVVGVLQMDMTNYKSGNGVDLRLITDNSNTELKTFLTELFDAYLAPLGLTRGTYTCGYGCSDHASWTTKGFPAAMMFEAGNGSGYFPNIHKTTDTLASMSDSAANSAKFAKFGLAFLGELAKTSDTIFASDLER